MIMTYIRLKNNKHSYYTTNSYWYIRTLKNLQNNQKINNMKITYT